MPFAASIVFLTPLAGLLALLAVIPLGAFLLAERRLRAARALLGLRPPPGRVRARRAVALAAVPALLALAAAQPALRRQSSVEARTDAAAFVVLDTSRSMAATPGTAAQSRLARARAMAGDLANTVGDVPLGVATLTDRVLPDLFPTADRGTFQSVVRSVSIEDPPPRESSVTATAFSALAAVGSQGFFERAVRHRVLVLVTDGESRPFDAAGVASALAAGPGVRVVVARVGAGRDRVRGPRGGAEPYRPDPAGAAASVQQLARATGGRVVAATGAAAGAAVRAAVGSGPTVRVGLEPTTDTLAPYVALLALIPLAVALRQK
jgi:Mg-chelatase subunit ChlD